MKVLSFVIPSYNSEKFLDKCINSFLDNSILEKLEIIVVNDGSTDKTETIALSYCEKYPDTVRLISQENKGHGGALNTGCMSAKGKYLKVIDADDWVVNENLSDFVALLENCNSDVVLTHHYTIDVANGEQKKWMCYPREFDIEYSFDEISKSFSLFERSLTFHGITYKTEFYQQCGYRLLEKIFYEDHEFSTFPCCFAKSITPFDIFIYCYRIGDVTQSVSQENQLKRISHSESVLKKLAEGYIKYSKSLDAHALEFIAQKTKILLLSYLTTALLVNKDRKQGREMAETIINYFKLQNPRVFEITSKKFKLLKLFNYLHLSKNCFDKLLSSKLYHCISRKKDFIKEIL